MQMKPHETDGVLLLLETSGLGGHKEGQLMTDVLSGWWF